jgi:hypothetical protein
MTEKIPGTILEYSFGVRALPEYRESDIHLSIKVADQFTKLLQDMGISNCELLVSDGYTIEEEEHYVAKIRTGEEGVELTEKGKLSIKYSAINGDEKFEGIIGVKVKLPAETTIEICKELEVKALEQYQALMEKIYPDWDTKYDDAGPQFIEVSEQQEKSIAVQSLPIF